ncbi:MAG: energy-dependent translational throttle protein EttA [Calditrichaeota bacterium]|nr:energy-dependent translational throttle protein EttA [Calditrichota bacterium]MCB9369017.1 energy-dependent translational throttle protein EttA [Calditrichota bacterium]
MAPQFIFVMEHLVKLYSGEKVLDNINLAFYPGAKIGLVGDNGSGKSTLLRIMAGIDRDFQGYAEPAKGVRAVLVAQEPELDLTKTVRENVELAFAPTLTLIEKYNKIAEEMAEMDGGAMEKALEKMQKLQDEIDKVDGWNLEHQVEVASDALFLPDGDLMITQISGGERRRVALCKALIEKPDILLLDEPTNHLDAETVLWLEKQLREFEGTVIISTHDRYFLDNITKWILELDEGKGIPWEGNYTSWLEQKIELMERADKKPSAKLASLRRELAWIKLSQRERLAESHKHVLEYEKRSKEVMEISNQNQDILIAPGPHLGDVVLEINGVSKGFGGANLIENLSLTIPPGSITGVIGPNGSGKTTLFRMITGEQQPDSGAIRIGPSVVLSYVSQMRDDLDDKKTVFEEITGGVDTISIGNKEVSSRAYVSRFNFKGGDQQKYVTNLSGGERNRVHLAKLLRKGGNFLILDEPSNDLDITTLRLLENALLDFNGCVMVISHDRFFLDRICTHILAFEGNGVARWFEGNFEAYEQQRRAELGANYDRPRRSLYRKLTA